MTKVTGSNSILIWYLLKGWAGTNSWSPAKDNFKVKTPDMNSNINLQSS